MLTTHNCCNSFLPKHPFPLSQGAGSILLCSFGPSAATDTGPLTRPCPSHCSWQGPFLPPRLPGRLIHSSAILSAVPQWGQSRPAPPSSAGTSAGGRPDLSEACRTLSTFVQCSRTDSFSQTSNLHLPYSTSLIMRRSGF